MAKQALVVDDSRLASDALADILKVLGCEVIVSNSPRDAVQRLETISPDVVFLDVNMPGVSGLEVCAYIRRDPRIADIPIIVISGLSQPENVEQARQAGATKFLAKPVTVEIVEQTLNEIFESGQARA